MLAKIKERIIFGVICMLIVSASLLSAVVSADTFTLQELERDGGFESGALIFVETAYAEGVPMGGDLRAKPRKADAPTFAVWALNDPESGNLDRIQIIKGFINKWGLPDEKIYHVALSDGRTAGADGKAPAVGNTVNVENATYTNDIGDTQRSTMWSDPDFDPEAKALYYVRVLEIPTPRWPTYDSARNNLEVPEELPGTFFESAA